MGEGTLIEAAAGQRYVIERPRLTKLLDESNARIILLLAPAGYGKTTLARQWLAQGGRQFAWYRATSASGDVAALAADIAHLTNPYIQGVEGSLLRHLRALPTPAGEARALGKTLAEAMQPWPPDLWLAIDDYHAMMTSDSAQELLEVVADAPTTHLIVTSRRRPSWASARRVIYDEALVLGPAELALTDSEALQVLRDAPRQLASDLLPRARGWPAVIRMAALSGQPPFPRDALPHALHSYFAEETFQTAGKDVRRALMRLLPYPTLSPEILAEVLGEEAWSVCEEATTLGFLTREPEGSFDLHPLLRAFLEAKLLESPREEAIFQEAFSHLLSRGDWDAAFTIAKRFDRPALIEQLLDVALSAMLEANRLTTLQEWLSFAGRVTSAAPLLDLAEAEIARRAGNYDLGEARAIHAARNLRHGSPHLSRAYAVASECAQFALRGDRALRYGRLSEEHAITVGDRRRAVWDQLVTSSQVENGEIGALLSRFEELGDRSAASMLRILVGKQLHAMLEGNLDDASRETNIYLELVQRVDDALVTSSFLYRAAFVRMLTGEYEGALRVGKRALEEVTSHGLAFAVPHITACLAGARIGTRHFRRANALLDHLANIVARKDEPFERANWHTLRTRLLLSMGAPEAALREIQHETVEIPTIALRAEFLGLQALASCVSADIATSEIDKLIEEALGTSKDVQGQTLALLTGAVMALQGRRTPPEDALVAAEAILIQRANYDNLVLAYRTFPPLLTELRRRGTVPEPRIAATVRRARDAELAASFGWEVGYERRPRPLLTQREAEVFELMRKGLMNKEIARQLFISESTVKVHVRHILEKLGARSRTEAVLRLQEEV